MTEDLCNLKGYDRAKAIVNFCDKETKNFEKIIDRAILDIFERNGINIPNTNKGVLQIAFDLLKSKGTTICINDVYHENETFNAEVIKQDKLFTIVLVEDRYLECGIELKEIKND